MNLADMLTYADIHDLGRIAKTYELPCNPHSKNELIQSILTAISRTDRLGEEFGRMDWNELRFLNSLLFDERDSFSLEELTGRVMLGIHDPEVKKQANARETIARFKHRGWLFAGHHRNNKYLFLLPEDLKRRFREALSRRFQAELEQSQQTPPAYREEGEQFTADFYQFLHYLSQNELLLNAEGFLYKRSLQQLTDRFSIEEEALPKTAWRFGYGRKFREYPARFSLMYDYGYYNGLIEEQGNVLRLTDPGRFRVLENRREELTQVYRFWLRLYKGPIPNLSSLVQWIALLSKPWTSVSSLSRVLAPLIKPFYYDTPEAILTDRVIPMMIHLGLVRFGEFPDRGSFLQVTRMGAKMVQGITVSEEDRIILPE
ncbi:hypothetical protein [Gorillibacterium timonense]|uniref:hypothetical protein n=1 Tax=Gorillibacterium timonense TaxID=1689269 RepID=UPI00071CD1C8|nr:hypothetical protein [Gorillibacterium timonense]